MSDVIQQEFFALPVAPHVVARIDGEPLYGSKTLNFMFLQSISKVSTTKPVADDIRKLIKEKTVIPCWMTKGVRKIRKFVINEKGAIRHIAGFYDPSSKKVIILVDNHINKWGFASNKVLSEITIHECIHMFADKKPTKFYSAFKKELNKFYYAYFNEIFEFGGKPVKEMENIVRFIASLEKRVAGVGLSNALLKRYYNYLNKHLRKYSGLKGKEFDKRLMDYITILKFYSKSVRMFLSARSKYTHILNPLQKAYQSTFGGVSDTIPIQELFVVSEVISVSSEIKIRSSIYKMFK